MFYFENELTKTADSQTYTVLPVLRSLGSKFITDGHTNSLTPYMVICGFSVQLNLLPPCSLRSQRDNCNTQYLHNLLFIRHITFIWLFILSVSWSNIQSFSFLFIRSSGFGPLDSIHGPSSFSFGCWPYS